MSLVPKRFCFCCKKASEELEAENKTLKFCNDCQIAQYCDRKCQLIDFKNYHKRVCAKTVKPAKVKQAEVELGLKVKGFDVNKKWLNVDELENPVVEELFQEYSQYSEVKIRCMIEISRVWESYHGMEFGLGKKLKLMMTLQPAFLHLR